MSSGTDLRKNTTCESEEKPEIIEKLESTYKKLFRSVAHCYRAHPETADRLRLINNEIEQIIFQMDDLIDDLDRGRFDLTPEEERAIEDRENLDRAIKRIQPLMLISLLYETGWFTEPAKTNVEHYFNYGTLIEDYSSPVENLEELD